MAHNPIQLSEADLSVTDLRAHLEQLLEQGLREGAPGRAFEIDQPIAEACICPRCSKHMRYIAYSSQGASPMYIALAGCEACNVATAF